MKTTIAKKSAFAGAGAGLVLFALFGLVPGSLLGGAAGLKFAGSIYGLPLESGLVARAMVLASMLVGVMASGITIVTATSAAGWLVGNTAETMLRSQIEAAEVRGRDKGKPRDFVKINVIHRDHQTYKRRSP